MVCECLTLAGVYAGCHHGTSCAPVQPARRPWCAPAHQCSQRDVHGVRLRAHDADVLVYDISVITCCGNSRASVALPQWVLCEPSLLDWNDAEYAFLFWMQGGVPGQFSMSPGMRWYIAVGLHTMPGISDKLRELTHYDHGALPVNQALYGIQDALQDPHAITCLYR